MRNRGGGIPNSRVRTGCIPDKTDRARPPRRHGSPAGGSLGFCCWPVPATAAPMNPSEVLVKDSLRVFDMAPPFGCNSSSFHFARGSCFFTRGVLSAGFTPHNSDRMTRSFERPHMKTIIAHTSSAMVARRILVGAIVVAIACAPLAFSQSSGVTPPDDQAVRQRADALLQQMTLAEKIGQLSQLFEFEPQKTIDEAVSKGQLGSVLFVTDPAETNRLQHLAVDQTRMHIPLIFGFDVIHGFRTIFPVPIAMAASWDPSAAAKAQTIAAKEARSVGIHWAFAPMLDIARDPRWGRIVEGAGEDPYLGSAMAAAQVRGFQGEYIGAPDHVLACMKHFAGYGAAEGGRDYDGSYISDAQMENVYLPPFHAAVKAGVGSAMSAYMDLNDVPATGNRWLLTDVLRQQWGFNEIG